MPYRIAVTTDLMLTGMESIAAEAASPIECAEQRVSLDFAYHYFSRQVQDL